MNVRRVCGFPAVTLAASLAFLCASTTDTSAAGSIFGAYFETLYSYSTVNTWYPVVADLDLDGRDDVVSVRANYFGAPSATLLIRFGEPNGRLAPIPLQLTIPDVSFDAWPCIDDIDGDGIPDVVIGGGAYLVICRGLGGRTFASAVSLPEQCYGYVSAADLSGDGIPDYACIDHPFQAPDSVRIRFGTGGMAFAPGPAFRIRRGSEGAHLRDFNGDQLPDVLVGADTTSTLLLNLGGGAFAQFDVGAADAWPAGDLNGDGLEDVVSYQGALLNNGDGTFQALIPHGMNPQCTVDLNEDGKLDLVGTVVLSTVRYVRVMPGHGDGTFGPEVLSPTCYASEVLSHGDFDQDGHQDLVLLRWDTYHEAYMFGRGTGGFRQHARTFPSAISGSFHVGNLGPEPYPDIVVRGRNTAAIAVLLSEGPADYAAPLTYSTPNTPSTLALGDLNGDGRDDVVAGYQFNPVISVWMTQPGGALGSRTDVPSFGGTAGFRLADLDNNGTLDLISRIMVDNVLEIGEDSTSWWRSGNGDGTFGSRHGLPGSLGTDIAIVDMDGNGALDIVSGGNFHVPFPIWETAFRVMLAGSPGAFPGYSDYLGTGGSASLLGAGHFNTDALSDIVTGADSVWLYPGVGAGALGTRTSLGRGAGIRAVADLDGDAKPDLLSFTTLSYSVGVRLGSDGPVAPEVGYGPQRHVSSTLERYVLADVDGNGALDAIVSENSGAFVTVLLNLTNTPTVGVPPPSRSATLLSVRATPNPAPHRVSLRLGLAGTTPVEVQLFDLSGRRVKRESIPKPAGPYVTLALEGTERLAPGVYLVRVRQGNETATARVCLMR